MSKRYYYRRSKRTYPKQKWQMNFADCDLSLEFSEIEGFPGNSFYSIHKMICQTVVPTGSSGQGVVSANNIVKTGNFKVKGDYIFTNTSSHYSIILYVVFVPQGISPNNTAVSNDNLGTSLFFSHPEWVLCWTRFDTKEDASNHFSMSSRLKRNLNSGDQIMFGALIIKKTDTIGVSPTFNFRATACYYARAN